MNRLFPPPRASSRCRDVLLVLLTTLAPLASARVHAQTYSTAAIIARADSILRATVPPALYPYYHYDADSYYEYQDRRGRSHWDALVDRPRTRGRFVGVNVRFGLRHPDHPWIMGATSVQFDRLLQVVRLPSTAALPRFLLEGRESDALTRAQALELARTHGLRAGLRPPEAYLEFVPAAQTYLWRVTSIQSERRWGTSGYSGQADNVDLDAFTGRVVAHRPSEIARPDGLRLEERP